MSTQDRWSEIRHQHTENLFIRSLDKPENKRTVFYVHGLGESGLCFERLMAHRSLDAFNHLAIDMPGYGKSAWTATPCGLEDHADRLSQWVMDHSLENLILAGHSMGGVLGTMLCERLGDRVIGFVNIEGNISLDDCQYSGKTVQLGEETWLNGGFEAALENLFADAQHVPALRAYYPSMRLCDPRTYFKNSQELVDISSTETLATRLAKLNVPVIYLHGDPHGTGEHSRALLSEAGIAWQTLSPAGHWPFLDQKEAFVKAMLAYLSTL